MPSTLIPACPLCGLRFSNRALLDLHLREDHLERNRPAEPDRDDSDDAGASRLRAGGPSGSSGLASGQPRTTDEVVPVTAATLRPRSRWAMTVAHRAVRVPRYVSEELARGSKAIIRSARRKTRLNVLLSEQRVSVWRRRPGRLVSRSVRPGDPRCRPARPGDRGSGIRRRPASRAGAQRARFGVVTRLILQRHLVCRMVRPGLVSQVSHRELLACGQISGDPQAPAAVSPGRRPRGRGPERDARSGDRAASRRI